MSADRARRQTRRELELDEASLSGCRHRKRLVDTEVAIHFPG